MTDTSSILDNIRKTSAVRDNSGGGLGRRLTTWLAILVVVFLVIPTLVIIPISFGAHDYLEFPPSEYSLRWYGVFLTDPGWYRPALFSLRIAILVAPLATVMGTAAALATVRGRIGYTGAFRALMAAPLIVPQIIYAIAVLLFFGPLGITGSTLGFVLAHTAVAVPFAFLVVSAALYRLDPDLELAAMNLGASRLTAVRKVTLPLLVPSLVASGVFSFLSSFDDAIISFFISGLRDKSLPRRMWEEIEFTVSPAVAAVSTLLTVISIVLIVVLLVIQDRLSKSRGRVGESADDENEPAVLTRPLRGEEIARPLVASDNPKEKT